MTSPRFFCFYLRSFGWTLMSLALLLGVQPTWAQDDSYALDDNREPYSGVNPTLRNFAPGKTVKSIEGQQKITWIGFQAQGDRAHVFIQSDQPPLYEISKSSDDRVLIDFPSATLHTRNDMRTLDTGFFPTMVRYVKATQVSRTIVRVTIKLRRSSTGYKVKKDKEMLHFFFNSPKTPIDVLEERERELENAAKKGQVTEYKESPTGRSTQSQKASEDDSPSSSKTRRGQASPSLNP